MAVKRCDEGSRLVCFPRGPGCRWPDCKRRVLVGGLREEVNRAIAEMARRGVYEPDVILELRAVYAKYVEVEVSFKREERA